MCLNPTEDPPKNCVNCASELSHWGSESFCLSLVEGFTWGHYIFGTSGLYKFLWHLKKPGAVKETPAGPVVNNWQGMELSPAAAAERVAMQQDINGVCSPIINPVLKLNKLEFRKIICQRLQWSKWQNWRSIWCDYNPVLITTIKTC